MADMFEFKRPISWVDRARSVENATLAQTMSRIRNVQASEGERVKVAKELVEWIEYLNTTSETFRLAFRNKFGAGHAAPVKSVFAGTSARPVRAIGKRIEL